MRLNREASLAPGTVILGAFGCGRGGSRAGGQDPPVVKDGVIRLKPAPETRRDRFGRSAPGPGMEQEESTFRCDAFQQGRF